jgi:hypothetical protein
LRSVEPNWVPSSVRHAFLQRTRSKFRYCERQVGHGRERRRTGQQVRMARQQQQRLLTAHAAAERIDPGAVDPEPRQRRAQDLGHAREIGDLAA